MLRSITPARNLIYRSNIRSIQRNSQSRNLFIQSTSNLSSKFNSYSYSSNLNNYTYPSNIRYFSSTSTNQDSNQESKPSSDEKKKDTTPLPTKIVKFTKSILVSTWEMIRNPKETWESIKHVIEHYVLGSKLLWAELKISFPLFMRLIRGRNLTRRERNQLVRTSSDLFRVVPLAVFVIVPFMELLLPFALKIFPNLLPSTFTTKKELEEKITKQHQIRLSVVDYMQETLREVARKKNNDEEEHKKLIDVIEKIRKNEKLPQSDIIDIAKLFKEDLTLDNLSRMQLIAMCKYMGLNTFGTDSFLRFQLRLKFSNIRNDDMRIKWEGINTLNTLELREACRERGMRSLNLTHFQLRNQLQDWLEISNSEVPISLLIMSRAFNLSQSFDEPETIVKNSLSALEPETINEAILSNIPTSEENDTKTLKRKLESIKFQEELIKEESQEEIKELNDKIVVDTTSTPSTTTSTKK